MQELVGVVLITCGNPTGPLQLIQGGFWFMSDCTFEKIDLLPSVVAGSRQGEGGVYVIGDGVEAHADVPRVVIVQHAIVKPPVPASLREVWGR